MIAVAVILAVLAVFLMLVAVAASWGQAIHEEARGEVRLCCGHLVRGSELLRGGSTRWCFDCCQWVDSSRPR